MELSFRTSSRRVVSKVVEGDQAARDLRRVRTFFVLHCSHVDVTRPWDPELCHLRGDKTFRTSVEDRYDVEDERKRASIVGRYVISESTVRSAGLIARSTYPGRLRGRCVA